MAAKPSSIGKENCVQLPLQALAAMLLGAACMVPANGTACSLVPPDALLLKKAMAKEIAFRLAIDVAQVPLNDITAPELHRPWALGEDCSGRDALHHSAGFRIALAIGGQAFTTMGKPHTASGAAGRYRDRLSSGFYPRRPWAGVQRNYWRSPVPQEAAGPDFSAFGRWPYLPTERDMAASGRSAAPSHRWPQYPVEAQVQWQHATPTPTRWSTMAMPAGLPSQRYCRYEGVATVLGYDASSPVAVNFTQQCDGA